MRKSYFNYLEVADKEISTIDKSISGTGVSKALDGYVSGSYKVNYTPSLISIGAGNFATGINAVVLRSGLNYQMGINPPIMKNDTQTLKLPPITISWGRYAT